MQTKHYTVIGLVVLAALLFYLLGDTVTRKKTDTAKKTEKTLEPGAFDVLAYVNSLGDTLSPAEKRDSVKLFTRLLQEGKNTEGIRQAVSFFTQLEKPIAVAYGVMVQAENENTRRAWEDAGDIQSYLMATAPDEAVRHYLGGESIRAYEKAAGFAPEESQIRIKLAAAHIDDGRNPMQGITVLREVLAKDSQNVDAQLMMGKFSILSGQMDKALLRFEKVLSLQPSNPEALLGMAQVWESRGNTEEAARYLERCLKSDINPAYRESIRKHLGELKNQRKN